MSAQSSRQPVERRRVLLGLLGYPIAHSAAPAMHEAAGDAHGLRTLYRLLEIPGLDAAGLRRVLNGVRELGFCGINVTFPYKEAVVPLLDDLAPAARSLAAVNTVLVREGRLIGHNTDTTGFEAALRAAFGQAVPSPVALLGAGGMGRAAGFALARLGLQVRVLDAAAGKAARLAEDIAHAHAGAGIRVAASLSDLLDGAAGLVNATPVGMLPNRDSPVPERLLHPGLWVADCVYNPLVTPLLSAARRVGAPTLTGRSLALHQGYDAFRLFTGLPAPRAPDVMAAAFDAAVAK